MHPLAGAKQAAVAMVHAGLSINATSKRLGISWPWIANGTRRHAWPQPSTIDCQTSALHLWRLVNTLPCVACTALKQREHSTPTFPICLLVLATCLAGCNPLPEQVRALPAPPAGTTICYLPATLHQRNELGPLGQGSCVHGQPGQPSSVVESIRAGRCMVEDLPRWRYASRLMQRLDAAGIDYAYTEKADPRFLDWCTRVNAAPSMVEAIALLHIRWLGASARRQDLRSDPGQQSPRQLGTNRERAIRQAVGRIRRLCTGEPCIHQPRRRPGDLTR